MFSIAFGILTKRAILSHVETRQVKGDYTVQFEGQRYAIDAGSVVAGLRGATVHVEQRMDGTIAMRFKGRYLAVRVCATTALAKAQKNPDPPARRTPGRKSQWMNGFWGKPAPSMKDAIRISNATS